jgi:hypothetical protein
VAENVDIFLPYLVHQFRWFSLLAAALHLLQQWDVISGTVLYCHCYLRTIPFYFIYNTWSLAIETGYHYFRKSFYPLVLWKRLDNRPKSLGGREDGKKGGNVNKRGRKGRQ